MGIACRNGPSGKPQRKFTLSRRADFPKQTDATEVSPPLILMLPQCGTDSVDEGPV